MSYSIGDLSALTGEPRKTLRYWTDQGLLNAERSPANYRLYEREAINRVTFIRTAQAAGFRLRDIKDLFHLAERERKPCSEVKALAVARLEVVREQLETLKRLETALRFLAAIPETACPEASCTFLDL